MQNVGDNKIPLCLTTILGPLINGIGPGGNPPAGNLKPAAGRALGMPGPEFVGFVGVVLVAELVMFPPKIMSCCNVSCCLAIYCSGLIFTFFFYVTDLHSN